MLVAALETEVAAYLEAHAAERGSDGHALVVRNGKSRTRKVTLGAGTIAVSAPRVNDRGIESDGGRRRFSSRILPPYMRRSPKVAEVLPVLYLRGLPTGDFGPPMRIAPRPDQPLLGASHSPPPSPGAVALNRGCRPRVQQPRVRLTGDQVDAQVCAP
jgi:hypothetical protein